MLVDVVQFMTTKCKLKRRFLWIKVETLDSRVYHLIEDDCEYWTTCSITSERAMPIQCSNCWSSSRAKAPHFFLFLAASIIEPGARYYLKLNLKVSRMMTDSSSIVHIYKHQRSILDFRINKLNTRTCTRRASKFTYFEFTGMSLSLVVVWRLAIHRQYFRH